MRIDAHIHYTPPSLAADLATFAEEEPFWGLMLAPQEGGKSVQGWASAERMIADMDAAGIDKVVLMGEYRRSHEACVARNNLSLELLRRWPERIVAFAVVQPKAGQPALDELARCLDGGMLGVGELGPYGQGYRLDDRDFLRLVEACIERDVPINLHTNEEVGRFYPGKATTPLRHYYQLAARYPELRLILAHWGGGLPFYELMPEVRRTLRNVYYDTAASPLLFRTADIFDVALRCIDHRKILYASDYPLLIYPRTQTEPDFRPFLRELDALELAADVRDDIMGGNAARLLRLGGAASAEEALAAARKPAVQPLAVAPRGEIVRTLSTLAVVEAWPQTREVFDRYGLPYDDSPVPFWEPIEQAAAARGIAGKTVARLIAELNEAIAGNHPASNME